MATGITHRAVPRVITYKLFLLWLAGAHGYFHVIPLRNLR